MESCIGFEVLRLVVAKMNMPEVNSEIFFKACLAGFINLLEPDLRYVTILRHNLLIRGNG
jgi:hypothetical protein